MITADKPTSPLSNASDGILFLNPTIISGDPSDVPHIAHVYIDHGRIIEISTTIKVEDYAAETKVIDATGLVICPGFVDLHAHSDLKLLTEPEHLGKISQGCTVSHVCLPCGSCTSAAGSEPPGAPCRTAGKVHMIRAVPETTIMRLDNKRPVQWTIEWERIDNQSHELSPDRADRTRRPILRTHACGNGRTNQETNSGMEWKPDFGGRRGV